MESNRGKIAPPDFRVRKLAAALSIMAVGMLLALGWHAYEGWGLGERYPYNTFLFDPAARFSDLTGPAFVAGMENPYIDPTSVYGPFAVFCLRPFSSLPEAFTVFVFSFVSVGGGFLLLMRVLGPIILRPWLRMGAALFLLVLSYPVLFCLDRGNLEMVLALMIASAVFLISRRKHLAAALWLVPAISFKLFPAYLLVLLLRQRKPRVIILALLGVVTVTFASLNFLAIPPVVAWDFYHRNVAFITRAYAYGNLTLEGAASPWNFFKIVLITLEKRGLIEPVNFNYDGGFIASAYTVYMAGMALLAAGLAGYACLIEKEFSRCAMVLLLFISISAPTGGDYRLLYTEIAMVLLIALKSIRGHDWAVLIFLALTLVPKKEFILPWVGPTETLVPDVSINAVLNPILILGALCFLLRDGWRHFDPRWTRVRLKKLMDAFVPRFHKTA